MTSKPAASEVHLFIIWDLARSEERKILSDIGSQFAIIATYEVHWSKRNFAQNLTRFYGTKLPPGSGKEQHIGTGPFLLVIVRDEKPEHKPHATSRGEEVVNTKMFTSKSKHREWTGGGHRIHATNTPAETDHDLALLLGKTTADFLRSLPKKQKPDEVVVLQQDIIGADGWQSLVQFLYVLNATDRYLVLRNFAPLPGQYYAEKHGDIDLLVQDYATTCFTANATPVFPEPFRVHNKVRIGGEDVLFDFRFVGDGYYDKQWQDDMLERRVLQRGFYVPSKEDHFYSLLWHAYIHKPEVATDYTKTLGELAHALKDLRHVPAFDSASAKEATDLLARFLARHDYRPTRPEDKSVFIHENNLAMLEQATRRRAKPLRHYAGRLKRFFHD